MPPQAAEAAATDAKGALFAALASFDARLEEEEGAIEARCAAQVRPRCMMAQHRSPAAHAAQPTAPAAALCRPRARASPCLLGPPQVGAWAGALAAQSEGALAAGAEQCRALVAAHHRQRAQLRAAQEACGAAAAQAAALLEEKARVAAGHAAECGALRAALAAAQEDAAAACEAHAARVREHEAHMGAARARVAALEEEAGEGRARVQVGCVAWGGACARALLQRGLAAVAAAAACWGEQGMLPRPRNAPRPCCCRPCRHWHDGPRCWLP